MNGQGTLMLALITISALIFMAPTYSGPGIDTSGCQSGQVLTYSGDHIGCETPSSSGSLPSGMIAFVDAGSCPAGFTEDSTFDGAYILGTVAANSDAGATGGSSSYTPAGTVSQPTFTGTATTFTNGNLGSNGSKVAVTTQTSYTPAGTVSAPTFTGTTATIQPSYIKVIACKKN